MVEFDADTINKIVALSERCNSAEKQRDQLKEALSPLLEYAEAQVCPHDETYRGGAIWEICSQCGTKWADDEGGRPEHKEPAAISEARAVLKETSNE